ncbi:MAG TPA: hypothetical protein VEQ13_00800 [Methylomirabilota bacterium]|nr:hypothetical protein [Methylomirabilota bacterium]
MQARYDKQGKRLPDTGHGCGCDLCAASGAARYERRSSERSTTWSPVRRRLARWVRAVTFSRRSAAA